MAPVQLPQECDHSKGSMRKRYVLTRWSECTYLVFHTSENSNKLRRTTENVFELHRESTSQKHRFTKAATHANKSSPIASA